MKSFFKILVLGVVPIVAVTMTADQALAADEGSQLIFQSNMANKNFISILNSNSASAVTVLTQYYNDEMTPVVWYLRVVPAGGNVLVDPFDHTIPMSKGEVNVGDVIMDSGKANSGNFVIAVTAVGHDANDDDGTADSLFPEFLVGDTHDKDSNIDNCGGDTLAAGYDPNPSDDDCDDDASSKNVSDWDADEEGKTDIDFAEPIAFNHLSGHFTEAVVSTAVGGSDQTASWGGTPTIRRATASLIYSLLDGDAGTMLAEENAGGSGMDIQTTSGSGYTNEGKNTDKDSMQIIKSSDSRTNRVLTGGSLVLPALYDVGDDTTQSVQFLSAADDFGGAGKYKLIKARTAFKVNLVDSMGTELVDPATDPKPVYGGGDDPATPAGLHIIVEGIGVMTNATIMADPDKEINCGGNMIDGPWTVADLTGGVPEAADFIAGLQDKVVDTTNATPGWIQFERADTLKCTRDYGEGDGATSSIEDNDGIPTSDVREYTGGTQVAEEQSMQRTFVVTGRAVLQFATPTVTFGASWTLKTPGN